MNRPLDDSKFQYGIEHESPLISSDGQFVDFTNTGFEQIKPIIDELPLYDEDYPSLRVGDLKVKEKRWYIEGYERFGEDGGYLGTEVKGIETRTPVSTSIEAAVDRLRQDYNLLTSVAKAHGYRPVAISFNPFTEEFRPQPPLNSYEQSKRSSLEDQTSDIYMLTYGPDINLSHPDLSIEDTIDIGKKLTFYSPYIVPFSFSSPFHMGKPWLGLSRRTYYRTGRRPSALVFFSDSTKQIDSNPPLTELARIPAEAGRIEFKAFDTCANLEMYGALMALVKGLAMDTSLAGRALVPDEKLHQHSALHGLRDPEIHAMASKALAAAEAALGSADRDRLSLLKQQLIDRTCLADTMLERYHESKDIIKVLEELS